MIFIECVFDLIDEEKHLHQCIFCNQKVKSTYHSRQIHADCLKQDPPVSDDERKVRKDICGQCKWFNNSRCAKIHYGCKPVYIRYLRSRIRNCPLGLWPTLITLDAP